MEFLLSLGIMCMLLGWFLVILTVSSVVVIKMVMLKFLLVKLRDFLHCSVDLGLIDINSASYHYTWTNHIVWSNINCDLCNQAWFGNVLQAIARFLPMGYLYNHSPCVISPFELPELLKVVLCLKVVLYSLIYGVHMKTFCGWWRQVGISKLWE